VKLLDDGGKDYNGTDTVTFPQRLTIKVLQVFHPPLIALASKSIVTNVDSSCVTALGHVNLATQQCLPNPPTFERTSMSKCVVPSGAPPMVSVFAGFAFVGSIEEPSNAAFTVTPFNASEANRIFETQPTVLFPCGALVFKLITAQSGVVTYNVTLTDGNGQTSAPSKFTLIVTAVNRAPSFDILPIVQTVENVPFSQVNVVTRISTGDLSPQKLTFFLTFPPELMVLFSKPPTLSPENGQLTFTPAPDRFGDVLVNVTLKDDAGTQRSGSDTSVMKQMVITIRPVNNQPQFSLRPGRRDVQVLQSSGQHVIHGFAMQITAGHPNEDECIASNVQCKGQSLTFFTEDISAPELFSVLPMVSRNGTLNFTLAPAATGSAVIRLYLQDDGNTTDGGVDKSPVQIFTIYVQKANIPPSVSLPWTLECLTQASLGFCTCPAYLSPQLSDASPVCRLSGYVHNLACVCVTVSFSSVSFFLVHGTQYFYVCPTALD
jgi:hypothetical protein